MTTFVDACADKVPSEHSTLVPEAVGHVPVSGTADVTLNPVGKVSFSTTLVAVEFLRSATVTVNLSVSPGLTKRLSLALVTDRGRALPIRVVISLSKEDTRV